MLIAVSVNYIVVKDSVVCEGQFLTKQGSGGKERIKTRNLKAATNTKEQK